MLDKPDQYKIYAEKCVMFFYVLSSPVMLPISFFLSIKAETETSYYQGIIPSNISIFLYFKVLKSLQSILNKPKHYVYNLASPWLPSSLAPGKFQVCHIENILAQLILKWHQLEDIQPTF